MFIFIHAVNEQTDETVLSLTLVLAPLIHWEEFSSAAAFCPFHGLSAALGFEVLYWPDPWGINMLIRADCLLGV